MRRVKGFHINFNQKRIGQNKCVLSKVNWECSDKMQIIFIQTGLAEVPLKKKKNLIEYILWFFKRFGTLIMDQDTAFPPSRFSHITVTYKPSTNKQRRFLAGEGEEEAGEGDVRSFPSEKVPNSRLIAELSSDPSKKNSLLRLFPLHKKEGENRLLPTQLQQTLHLDRDF